MSLAMAAKFRKLATTKGETFAVAEFLHSKEAHEREAAVFMLTPPSDAEDSGDSPPPSPQLPPRPSKLQLPAG